MTGGALPLILVDSDTMSTAPRYLFGSCRNNDCPKGCFLYIPVSDPDLLPSFNVSATDQPTWIAIPCKGCSCLGSQHLHPVESSPSLASEATVSAMVSMSTLQLSHRCHQNTHSQFPSSFSHNTFASAKTTATYPEPSPASTTGSFTPHAQAAKPPSSVPFPQASSSSSANPSSSSSTSGHTPSGFRRFGPRFGFASHVMQSASFKAQAQKREEREAAASGSGPGVFNKTFNATAKACQFMYLQRVIHSLRVAFLVTYVGLHVRLSTQ